MLQVSALLLVDQAFIDDNGNAHACGVMDTFTVEADLIASGTPTPADLDQVVQHAVQRSPQRCFLFVHWAVPREELGHAWTGRLRVQCGERSRQIIEHAIDCRNRNAKWIVELRELPLLGVGEHSFTAIARRASEQSWSPPLATFGADVLVDWQRRQASA
ncbi:MAG: hypothetical protein IT204_10085 [Fimbriimonadaceae bacterium]|nr:hypothetical protein [Fimbriimonadaceae bacterium]